MNEISFFCPNCNQKLEATEDMSGSDINCPACATSILIPVGESKKCPFCAEQIKVDAIKCKHCGEMLDADNSSAGPEQMPSLGKKAGKRFITKSSAPATQGNLCPICKTAMISREVKRKAGCLASTFGIGLIFFGVLDMTMGLITGIMSGFILIVVGALILVADSALRGTDLFLICPKCKHSSKID